MDKIKFFFENLGRNIKRFFHNVFIRSYGMDDLNKALIHHNKKIMRDIKTLSFISEYAYKSENV